MNKQKKPKVVFSILLTIICSLLSLSCGATPTSTPTSSPQYELYENEQLGIAIAKPADWAVENVTSTSVAFRPEQPSSTFPGYISLFSVGRSDSFAETTVELAEIIATELSQGLGLSNLHFGKKKDVEVDGHSGTIVSLTGTDSVAGELYAVFVAVITPDIDFVFTVLTPLEHAAVANELVEDIVPTMRFLARPQISEGAPATMSAEVQAPIPEEYELYRNEQMGLTIAKPKAWAVRESPSRLGVEFIANSPQRGLISLIRMDEGRDFDAESVMSVAMYQILESLSIADPSYIHRPENTEIDGYPGAKVMISGETAERGKVDVLIIGVATPFTAYTMWFILPSEDREVTNKLYTDLVPTLRFTPIEIPTAPPVPPILTPTPRLTQRAIPDGFEIYRDETVGIEIIKPRDWAANSSGNSVGFFPEGRIAISLVMIGKYESSGTTAEQLAETITYGFLEELRDSYGASVGMVGLGTDVEIDGRLGKKVTANTQTSSGEISVIAAAIVTPKEDYVFLFMTPSDANPSSNRLYEVMIPTARLLNLD